MSLQCTSKRPITVTVASYDIFIAHGLASELQAREGFSLRETLATEGLLADVPLKQEVDVLLFHPQRVEASLYKALHVLGSAYPQTRKILLLPHEDLRQYLQALTLGVQGVLLYRTMTSGELFRAIREVHEGKQFIAPLVTDDPAQSLPFVGGQMYPAVSGYYALTARETELLSYLVEGLSNREIAERLHIEMKTVKNHLTHIYSKLQVQNRLEAVVYYYRTSSAKGLQSPQLSRA